MIVYLNVPRNLQDRTHCIGMLDLSCNYDSNNYTIIHYYTCRKWIFQSSLENFNFYIKLTYGSSCIMLGE